MDDTFLTIGTHKIKITHPQKTIFPDDGITKEEFVDYYRRIARYMVPHVKGRPAVMFRVFGDIRGQGIYQQEIMESAPSWIPRVTVKKEGGTVTHVTCDDGATLVYLAGQDCITIHVWLSRRNKLDYPDQMIFDLDPPGDDFGPVRTGAFFLKGLLDELGMISFIKTTGSHGLHVVVPLDSNDNFETVRGFAQQAAAVMARREPQKFTIEQRKEKRQGRLFIDILRNAYGHIAVAPYSVRVRQGAPVATPLFWEELKEQDLNSHRYNIRNVIEHLENTGDPWKDISRFPQSLSEYRAKLKEIAKE
jgi:bifunctional non-homologous end joining protein LigD